MTVSNRVLRQDPHPELIRAPSQVGGLDSWINQAAPNIINLGGDPNRLMTPRIRDYLELITPDPYLPELTNLWRRRNFANLWQGLHATMLKAAFGHNHMIGALLTRVLDHNGDELEPLSLASLAAVTQDGCENIVDAFDGGVGFTLSNFNFHGIGLGTTGAADTDTDVETELTTQYTTDNTRDTGAQSQPSAQVYQSLGLNPVDATVAITEHGLLDNATVGSGRLFDRHTFTVINLSSGDSLESTYQGTFASGG